jgi:hypothetical protein
MALMSPSQAETAVFHWFTISLCCTLGGLPDKINHSYKLEFSPCPVKNTDVNAKPQVRKCHD